MIDPHAWAWPQWTIVALLMLGLAIQAGQHGKPRTGEHSFPVHIVSVILTLFLLTFGGFFA